MFNDLFLNFLYLSNVFFFYFMHMELFLVPTLVVVGYLLQLLLQPHQFELILEDVSKCIKSV